MITIQAGAMQWIAGQRQRHHRHQRGRGLFRQGCTGQSVTGESAIKPEYTGDGLLVLEPTYQHLILMDRPGRLGRLRRPG